MKKYTLLLLFSIAPIVLSVITIIAYITLVKPPVTDFSGLIILFVPPALGFLGFISAILYSVKTKKPYALALILLNLIFVFWWPVMHISVPLINF